MFKPFKARYSIRSPVKFRSPIMQKKRRSQIKEVGIGSPEPREQSEPPTSIRKNPNKTSKATVISPESAKTSGEGESPKTPLSPIREDEGEVQDKGMGRATQVMLNLQKRPWKQMTSRWIQKPDSKN